MSETGEETGLDRDFSQGREEEGRACECLNCKDMSGGKYLLSKKLTDLVRYVKPAASTMFRSIDSDL